jgi:3-hydroxybutyryl-CoA dehydrogenase
MNSIAIIGAGTMGAGIAGLFAHAGCNVSLVDLNEELLERGRKLLQMGQDALLEAGLRKTGDAEDDRRRVTTTLNLEEACQGVDLLVEAISEDLDLKKEMFRKFEILCPPDAILATNTSGLSVSAIAAATGKADRVAGMHFWNPPHIIPLVEVTRGDETSDKTAQALMDVSLRLGKKPILVRHDVPGFVGNRLQFAVVREALHLLSEGVASAEDIDTAMTAGPGIRYGFMGPLRTADLGGLDVFRAISEYLFAALDASGDPSPLMEQLVDAGKLGAKSGEGFYKYGAEDAPRFLAQRDRALLGMLRVLSDEEGE